MNIRESINLIGKKKLMFSAFIGALTWLNLIQYIFGDLQLNIGLQWLVNIFDNILTNSLYPFEFLAIKAIDSLNLYFSWNLELNPLWRPIFLSQWIIVFSVTKGIFSVRKKQALQALLITFFPLLASSFFAALLPNDSNWFLQGFIGVIPILGLFLGLFFIIIIFEESSNKGKQYFDLFKVLSILSIASWLVGLVSWLIFSAHGSAILGLAFVTLLISISIYIIGVRQNFTHEKSKRWIAVGLNVISSALLAFIIYIIGSIL